MATSPTPTRDVTGAARTGLIGAVVIGVAFFDGVFLRAPIALLAAAFEPSLLYVYVGATTWVVLLVVACCTWLDGR
jgi:hypothetical protein